MGFEAGDGHGHSRTCGGTAGNWAGSTADARALAWGQRRRRQRLRGTAGAVSSRQR
ncbi:hypothetical protein DB31_8552 [Hyalangium minutum]|uniref:Uncharacterized protein n=1 Tax=Hyalangium minutum TaxID=394096 RepID=A0A085WHN6_9BACT|nr:hypothetical protein DB31_8552 [Hyalangium minutum]